MKVCAIIPAFNEQERISLTIASLKSRREIHSIVVVDDGSTDATAERAAEAGATEVIRQKNAGKGAALTRGFAHCRESADVFLLLDADLGASASESVKLLRPIEEGTADMVIGLLPPDPEFHATGKSGGRGLVVRLARNGITHRTGQYFEQPLSGQRATSKAVLDAIGGMFASGFGVEVALTISAIRKGYRLVEVPTEFRHHVTGGDWKSMVHRGRQFRDVAGALRRS